MNDEKEYIKSLENLLIFMCQTHEETWEVLHRLAKEEGITKPILEVPTIQGLGNLIPIAQLAKIEFETPKYGFRQVIEKIKEENK